VVVDSCISTEGMIEMYADPTARYECPGTKVSECREGWVAAAATQS